MSFATRRRLPGAVLSLALMAALSGCGCGAIGPYPTPASSSSAVPVAWSQPSSAQPPAGKPATDPLTGGVLSGNEVFAVKIDNVAAAHPQVGSAKPTSWWLSAWKPT